MQLEIRAQPLPSAASAWLIAVGVGRRLQPRILAIDVEREQPAHVAGLRDELTDRTQAIHGNAPGRAFRPEPGERAAVEHDGRGMASGSERRHDSAKSVKKLEV